MRTDSDMISEKSSIRSKSEAFFHTIKKKFSMSNIIKIIIVLIIIALLLIFIFSYFKLQNKLLDMKNKETDHALELLKEALGDKNNSTVKNLNIYNQLNEQIKTDIQDKLKYNINFYLNEEIKNKVKNEIIDDIKYMVRIDIDNDIKSYLEEIKADIKDDIKDKVKNEIKDYVENTIKSDLKSEIKNYIKDDLKNDIRDDIKDKVKNEIKDYIDNTVKSDLKSEIKNQIESDINTKIISEVKNEIQTEVKNNIISDVKNEIKSDLKKEIKEELEDEIIDEMKKDIKKEMKDFTDDYFKENSKNFIKINDSINADKLQNRIIGTEKCCIVKIENNGKIYPNIIFTKGMIIAWFGYLNQIPDKWAICDGTQGTPDLRNKFILGNSNDRKLGETGGKTEITLSKTNLPKIGKGYFSTDSHNGRYHHSSNGFIEYVSSYSASIRKGSSDDWGSNLLIDLENGMNSTPINIMNPYYSLYYIMKL